MTEHLPPDAPTALTPFQIELATVFFRLPSTKRFLLAGGAALNAQHLIQRPTHDLDFFTEDAAAVPAARAELERAATARGWEVELIHDATTFARLVVHGPEDVLVDVALDAAPGQPASISIAGPTYEPRELAGRKVVALFDRAEARDFADVYALAHRYDKHQLLSYASTVDPGFDNSVFAEMLGSLGRFRDSELPLDADTIQPLREFFNTWRAELAHYSPP